MLCIDIDSPSFVPAELPSCLLLLISLPCTCSVVDSSKREATEQQLVFRLLIIIWCNAQPHMGI